VPRKPPSHYRAINAKQGCGNSSHNLKGEDAHEHREAHTACGIALAAAASVATAHGPTRQKHTETVEIDAPAAKVLPVTNYSSHLTVKPMGDNKSMVEWRGAFYRGYPNNDPPPELNEEAAIKAVSGVYRAGLDHLKKELEEGGS
jgi:hypothetical protein